MATNTTSTRRPAATKKAAAPKPVAKKAAAPKAPSGRKIRWNETEEFVGGKNQDGIGLGGVSYIILRNEDDGTYSAAKKDTKGKVTVLVEATSFAKAYGAAVAANKAAVAAADVKTGEVQVA